MKVTFHVDYRTVWGESLYIVGNHPSLGSGSYAEAMKMEIEGDDRWHASIELPDDVADVDYRYFVRDERGYVKDEWGHGNRLNVAAGTSACNVFDRWQDQPADKPFYSAAFTDCICRHGSRPAPVEAQKGFVTFSVQAPMVPSDMILAICGEGDALGNWNPEHAVRMNPACFPVWNANVPANGLNENTQYKFVVMPSEGSTPVAWDGGENRRLGVAPEAEKATVVAGLRFFNTMAPWKGAGTAIPVFSLRSEEDFGVGDFYDLLPMIDWAAETGQTFLQILPINDTTMTGTWTDSYPYNANSTFALHPMFLRLEEVGVLKDPARMEYYRNLAKELNALPEIDYERANNGKIEYLREIFAQDGPKVLKSDSYRNFVARNHHWLIPYAAFCTLRDRFGTPDFTQWGEYAHYSKEVRDRVVAEDSAAIDYVCYLQYHLDRQMRQVHAYANAKGIALKGDIPIGISRTSADAWQDTRLFNMDCQAGAPPDDFSVMGQNWGFPTYNWEEMNRDGFAWWKARFRKMAEYFDAYRIDHVLGFFRIWQIPMDALHGLLGYFNPALPFSPDEMRNNYDFWINVDRMTTPYIMDYFLDEFFGEFTQEVKEQFLVDAGEGRFRLKDEFATQRKVADYFASQPKDDRSHRICEGLLGLIDDVLFIEDPYEKGKYHPRISAQFTHIYRSLNDYERWCFNRLYNDFFYRRHNDFWYGKAMWKLPPLIDSTDMLVCAEDLGMIPACVPAVMNNLEILSLEIQRMPKGEGHDFGDTMTYPYFSVCTTSTHDMGGIRQWWEENREMTQKFYNNVLHERGDAPFFAEPWICDRIIDLHLYSPSMLCILPLQDWLSIDGKIRRKNPREEQINVPANPRHYWRYRMHLTIEELQQKTKFNNYLRDKIKYSGR